MKNAVLVIAALVSIPCFASGYSYNDKQWDEMIALGIIKPVDPVEVSPGIFVCTVNLHRVRFESASGTGMIARDGDLQNTYAVNRMLQIEFDVPYKFSLTNGPLLQAIELSFSKKSGRATYCRIRMPE